jgi:hypothetical protein
MERDTRNWTDRPGEPEEVPEPDAEETEDVDPWRDLGGECGSA